MTKITVSIDVKSTIEKVWESWNNEEHIVNWCSWHPDWHTTKAKNDLKVWWRFYSRMDAKDGSQWFDFEWTYTKVEEYKEIDYVMDDKREVKIIFEKNKDKIKITETFDAESINSLEMQREWWQNILNNFKNYTQEFLK